MINTVKTTAAIHKVTTTGMTISGIKELVVEPGVGDAVAVTEWFVDGE
jgi:hypothetical protein